MSTHNICFHVEIRKIFGILSVAMYNNIILTVFPSIKASILLATDLSTFTTLVLLDM